MASSGLFRRGLTRAVAAAMPAAAVGCAGFDPQRDPGLVLLPERPVEVPLQVVRNLPLAEVSLNGSGPHVFLLDTGSDCVIVDERIVDELALPREASYGFHTTDAGTRFERFQEVWIDELAIDAAVFGEFEGASADLSALAERLVGRLDGIIGIPLMLKGAWTIDYPGRRLVIERESGLAIDQPGVERLEFIDSTPAIEIRIDDMVFLAEIDTGSTGGLDLSEKDAAAVEFLEPPRPVSEVLTLTGTVAKRGARLSGTVRIGPLTLEQPAARIARNTSIGGMILDELEMTLDCRRGLVRIGRKDRGDQLGAEE